MVRLTVWTTGYVELWDVTDNARLTITPYFNILGSTEAASECADFSLSYTAVAANVGHVIQVRLLDRASRDYRDLHLDNISATSSIPEPTTISLFGIATIGLLFFRRFTQ